jgi:hypothetical protein
VLFSFKKESGMKASTPVCPLLSLHSPEKPFLCVEEECAFYLAPVKKCAVTVMGIQAMMNAQRLQTPGK